MENIRMRVQTADGLAVETVYYGSGTLCLSVQVGCALKCPFCASGRAGLFRNLTVEELQEQLSLARSRGIAPRRLTLSGIGEPLQNPENVLNFLERCRGRNLPVSLTTTAAPLHRLREFLQAPHNGLMISLHAGRAFTHRRLIPAGPNLEALWETLAQLWPTLSRRQRRKTGINYLLLGGVNDDGEELAALAERLRRFPEMTVHLLLPNAVPDSPFRSHGEQSVSTAAALLRSAGVHVRRSNRWRRQMKGGCGTLVIDRSEGSETGHGQNGRSLL